MIEDKAHAGFGLAYNPESGDTEQEKGGTQKLTLSQQVRKNKTRAQVVFREGNTRTRVYRSLYGGPYVLPGTALGSNNQFVFGCQPKTNRV